MNPDHPYLNPEHLLSDASAVESALALRHSLFRDSRGFPLSQCPDAVLPSATAIIYRPGFGSSDSTAWQVVCHQRADNGWWGFPGGRMEPGESIKACLHREVWEETGLKVHIERLTSVDSDPYQGALVVYPDTHVIQYCNLTFVCRAVLGPLRVSSESLAVEWCSIALLPEPFLPSQRWRLEQALVAYPIVPVR